MMPTCPATLSLFWSIAIIPEFSPKFICRMNWKNQKLTTQMGKRLFVRRNIGA